MSQSLYSMPSWLVRACAEGLGVPAFAECCEWCRRILWWFRLVVLGWWSLFYGMLVYQHTVVKPNDLSRVNLALMTANGIASVVFPSWNNG